MSSRIGQSGCYPKCAPSSVCLVILQSQTRRFELQREVPGWLGVRDRGAKAAIWGADLKAIAAGEIEQFQSFEDYPELIAQKIVPRKIVLCFSARERRAATVVR